MNRRLVLWRHGRTQWNLDHRFQGQLDVPLDEAGLAQAAAAAKQLAQLPPTAIISSDLGRAQVTAGHLAALTGLPVMLDERLRETYAGGWQGLERDELVAKYSDELALWAGGSDLRPGGGERRSEVAARMVAAIDEALADIPDGGTLVVATHGGAARAAVGELLRLPVEHWSILGVLTNCAWSVLSERPDAAGTIGWRLEEYNARSLPETAFGDDR
ncbi:MAG: glucosyl-3-phosphoglycerate phosphatase [Actinomycetota bacterium]|nr:glucosyl-3-phosphoglycerate phosphatase [Actinomycetota bacterium]